MRHNPTMSDGARPDLFDHVALVVPSLEKALEALGDVPFPVGEPQSFPSEGTREVYVGAPDATGRLLLMQPLGTTGPYRRALDRRGAGLHHLSLITNDLDALLSQCESLGWSRHAVCDETVAQSRTGWMYSPGVGTLLELQEVDGALVPGDGVVTGVDVPCADADSSRFSMFEGAVAAIGGVLPATLRIGGAVLDAASLRPAPASGAS